MKIAINVSLAELEAMKKTFRSLICEIIGCSKHKKIVAFAWSVGQPTLKKRTKMPLEISMTNEEQVKLHLTPVTEAGKPTKLDGKPTWEVVSGPAKLAIADDGLSADVISDNDDLSDTIIKISADADLGSGVEEIADTVTAHVTHANAKSLGLSADAPVLKS